MPVDVLAEVSRHKCLIYDGHPSEQLPVVIPFLLDGLQNHWRCVYLGSPEMVRMVNAALMTHGVKPAYETKQGSLILSSDRSHLAQGSFEPRTMIDKLSAMIDSAVQEGFEGLCATGDMLWELGTTKNFDRLLEYEARLEQLFREKPLRGICQYQRDIVPAQAVRDALATHRSAFIGDVLNHDNLFYIPPELLLEGDHSSAAKQGEWLCQQILRVLQAEQKRDLALKALQESESHQRHLAQQLAETNRNLEGHVRNRTAELEIANQQLAAFSYSVSHDLRGPLQSIVGFSEIIAQQFGEALGAKGRELLDRVYTGALRMGELIDGLLALSGVIRAEFNRVPIDLTALAEEVAREIREREPERSAELVIDREMRVVGDRALIQAVLTNLMGNAWKFTSKSNGARIEVGKQSDECETIFFVRDNGAGFDMKHAEKLFGVFERLHKQEEFPGTGVGLATVKRIISKHGGRIWAEGRPNHGATFFFTLPSEM
jgi:signal transduction histidine kinase